MEKTKIDIISGFLGAGKTTFIKKLVQSLYKEENVVILENEFGRINIDEETLGREGLTVKPIQAGCICCSSSMDLSKGIHEIINEYHPYRIIIEPTGIAKLSEINKLLQVDELSRICEIEHTVTIVDAKNYYVRTMISKDFFEDQIRASKVIFLSKTDQMEEEKQKDVKENISMIQPACIVVDKTWESIEPDCLKAYLEYTPEKSEVKHKLGMRLNYQNDFDRYEIVKEDCIDMDRMSNIINDIARGRYGEIHRVKGICRDSRKGLYAIDYIPGETIMKRLTENGKQSAQSKLCLIGRQLNKLKLSEAFC